MLDNNASWLSTTTRLNAASSNGKRLRYHDSSTSRKPDFSEARYALAASVKSDTTAQTRQLNPTFDPMAPNRDASVHPT
jgi:hypothetical protein